MKAKKKVKEVVSSIIEITKPAKSTATVDARSVSLQQYHSNVGEMGKKITKFAIELSPDNLLSVKMALMQGVQSVEKKIQENKER